MDRVAVVPLDPRSLIDGDLIVDFARRAEIGKLTLDDPGRHRNPSMNGFLCEVLARVPAIYDRSLAASEVGRTDHSVRRILSRHVSEDLLFNRDKRVMTLGQRRRVMAHFEEDNRTLHARHFSEVPFDAIFGLPDPEEDVEIQDLRARIDGLQTLLAMQMQVIVELLREREEHQLKRRVSRWLEREKKLLRASRAKHRGEG